MQAKPFFITGLPRSRTAWMSVFMSTGNSICYHESSSRLNSIEELKGIYQSSIYKFVGISDSGLGFFMDWILEHIEPRTVIIDRPISEVNQSLEKLGLPRSNFTELLHDELERFHTHPLVMWVPFEALNVKRVVQKAFWHLMPGEAFDEQRYETLAKMIIETDNDKTKQEYLARHTQIERFMKKVSDKVVLYA
jgi:hypothetical protein